ncbi:Hpt domain-containing protein [Vibrio sp. SCSIO 43140]|uniref:Hpt domain-containing protein n=1 Tax=Vibrio sp. SCSIO 43140 TaxID=2819100 RepID=UPI002074D979|nr:Hpt domain-containing protein [Vibrio sp. SCSIO 43140]USD61276.1 Hpt domain-containing protein [Vibrio sp. SCSIO 43140]
MNLFKRLNGIAVAIVLLWSIAVASVVYVSSQEEKITHLIDEITFSIDKLRQTLFLAQPYRARFSEQLELEIQLIHAQTVQLKSLTQSDLLSDVSHTVYLLERFVEQAQLLARDEARMDTFITSINDKPQDLSDPALSLSNRLSAVVLDTLFNESVEPRQVYLKLEDIQREAYRLPSTDRIHLLELNSQASVLLSQSANTEFLVERVVNHPVMTELSLRELQSERLVSGQVLFISLASLVAILCLFSLSLSGGRVARADNESELVSYQDELPAGNAQSTAADEPQNTESSGSDTKQSDRQLDRHLNHREVPSDEAQTDDSEPPTLAVVKSEQSTEQAKKETSVSSIQFENMLSTLDGDQESMLLLLGVFVSEHRNDAEKLRDLVDSDIEKATRVAHTLKGVSGSIFAEELRQSAIVAEQQLKDTQSLEPDAISELERCLSMAILSAEDYISTQSHQ